MNKNRRLEGKLQLPKYIGNPEHPSVLSPIRVWAVCEIYATTIWEPLRAAMFSPTAWLLLGYSALVRGMMILVTITIPFVLVDRYQYTQRMMGLAYVGLGIGQLLGEFLILLCMGWVKTRIKTTILVVCSLFAPIGLLVYCLTLQHNATSLVPIISMGLLGFGLVMTRVSYSLVAL
jgi:hypothetical protein